MVVTIVTSIVFGVIMALFAHRDFEKKFPGDPDSHTFALLVFTVMSLLMFTALTLFQFFWNIVASVSEAILTYQ